MTYLHLVWAELFRRKTRTFLTLVSILAAFLLFGLLDGVRVPAGAITTRDGKDVAFALDDEGERVQLRELEVGRNVGDGRQVTSGLVAGDTVVLDPPADLEDGSRVVPAGN